MSAQTYREHVVTAQRDELRVALRELCDKLPKCEAILGAGPDTCENAATIELHLTAREG